MMVGRFRDKPFLLGFGNFSGLNSLLNFGRVDESNFKSSLEKKNDGCCCPEMEEVIDLGLPQKLAAFWKGNGTPKISGKSCGW